MSRILDFDLESNNLKCKTVWDISEFASIDYEMESNSFKLISDKVTLYIQFKEKNQKRENDELFISRVTNEGSRFYHLDPTELIKNNCSVLVNFQEEGCFKILEFKDLEDCKTFPERLYDVIESCLNLNIQDHPEYQKTFFGSVEEENKEGE